MTHEKHFIQTRSWMLGGLMLMWMKDIRGGQLKLLSRDEIREIHYASLELLHNVGIKVFSDRALQILDEAGAVVDYEEKSAHLPHHLVEEAIRKTPSTFTLHGRGKKRYRFEQGRVHFGMSGAPPFVLDLNGERRQGTYDDIRNFFRLGDALELIHCPSACMQGTVEETGQPESVTMAHHFLMQMQNTDKPGPSVDVCREGAEDSIRLQLAVIDGKIDELRRKPLTWFWHNPTSPLTYSKELTDNAIVYAEQGLPILFAPEVMGGVSGPATIAGILAQQTAEFLGGAVITQMAAKDHRPPLMYGSVSGIVDMKTSVFCLGTAETALINVGTAQMARFYNVPSRGTGGTTDAIVPDAQSGIESATTALLAAMAGHTYIYNAAGALEPGVLVISYEKMVLDNDTLGMVARVLGGIEISEDTLATEVVDDVVVDKGGNFLMSEHTRTHFRSHFYPGTLNRELWEKWSKDGSLSARQVARERAKKILAEHQPEPWDADVEARVRAVVTEIEQRTLKG